MSIIGIDLGTTTSEVGIYRNGKTEIIRNVEEGESTIIPSVVLIENGKEIVGIRAKNQSVLKANNVVQEIKRLMGTDKKLKIEDKLYSPVEISAMILKKIKSVAEFYLGEDIKEAVITVPASFNDKARRDTKEAGRLAGLNVERIINEPTAASLAYGVNNLKENINILVYDFGGGTLDVTVLELYNGVLDVKASRGNEKLGGKNIDSKLIAYIAKKFSETSGNILDLKSARVVSALKNACEECKINLSFQEEWDVIVPYIGRDRDNNILDIEVEVKRKDLEKLIEKIVEDTERVVDEALDAAELKVEEVGKVILVGGSTRIPIIRKMISTKFGEEKVEKGINPDEAVAIGASIQGALKNRILDSEKSIIVSDTASYSLGVEVLGGKLDKIIERDTKLPIRVTKKYKTVEENQEEATINIYEGDSTFVREDYFIGRIDINKIPKNKRGRETIDITFTYDLNGILNTEVQVVSTGDLKNKTYKNGEEIERIEDIEKLVDKDLREEQRELVEEEENMKEVEQMQSREKIEKEQEEKKEETIEEQEQEEEDYSNIFGEVVNLVNYVNSQMETYEAHKQKEIKEYLADLLGHVKKDEYKECRQIEKKILKIIGIE